ncbi:MAG: helix-turn-helix transcriptional regulator, partial [Solirubrobacteraceae bacterium]
GLVALVAELRRAGGALALVVDDLQWSDPASLEFLGELAPRCEDLGVAVAVAIGTGQGQVDDRSLHRLAAAAGPRLLAPAPLSADAVRALVRERLTDVDDTFTGRLVGAADGNPFLVSELIDSAERHPGDAWRIPEGLSRTVLDRLQDAGAPALALAQAVAVLGEAPLRTAAALAGLNGSVGDDAADELVARHVLVAGESVRFAQPLVGEALRAAITPFALAARHRAAAGLLAEDRVDPDLTAAHLLHSRPGGEPWVCEALRVAARIAVARGAPARAIQLLERALAEPPPAEDRSAVLLELAGARAGAGRPDAIDTFEQALAGEHDRARRADAWRGLSRLLYARGEFVAAATAGARGRAELPAADPLAERLLALELTAASSVPELAADAIARLDALVGGSPPTEPTLLAMLCTHQAARVVEIERVPELAGRAVAGDPLIDPESHGIPLMYVAGALNFLDEPLLAQRLLDGGLARARELGDLLAELHVRSVRAWCLIFRGELERAGEELGVMLAAGEYGWRALDALCAMQMIVLRLERGDLDGARDALERAPAGAQVGQSWYEGAVALAAGDAAAALSAFLAAGAQLEDGLGVVNPGVLPWRSSAALAAAQLGRHEQARALVAVEVAQGRAAKGARALGIALRAAGLVNDDPRLLDESVAVLESSPARLELARSLTYVGIAQRRAGRMLEARQTLARALDLAQECGAIALVERATTELRASGSRSRRRPRTGVGALTPSERQTAELAAEGRTTRQIAASLFLSPKTVEGQLTSVFRKLGISSRSALGSRLGARAGQGGRRPPLGPT